MNEEIEIIDSSKMKILSEFSVEYDPEELESPSLTNTKTCFIKASDDWIVFATNSKGLDAAIGNIAFEHSSFKELSQKLEAVLSGKLNKEQLDALKFQNGTDEIIISVTSNLPLNQFAWVNRVNISNLREIELDDLEYGELSLPIKAAQKLHQEMKRLIAEGKI